MAEYIEREKAIFPLYRWRNIIKNTYGEHDEYVECLNEAMDKINGVPAADVVPVVRCKDCRYSMDDKIFGGMWCRGRKVTPDWFCADGTKMEVDK